MGTYGSLRSHSSCKNEFVPRAQLSISEHSILAILWRDGPCTTYAVMRRLVQKDRIMRLATAGAVFETSAHPVAPMT